MEPGAVVPPPTVAGPIRLLPFRALRLPASRVGDPGSLRQLSRSARPVGRAWRERARVQQDPLAGLHVHEYSSGGLTVRGLVGALDISVRARDLDERAVLPHEGIRPVQADDLADRMAESGLNPAPILLVHRSPDPLREILGALTGRPADHELEDQHGQHHRTWTIEDPGRVAAVNEALGTSRALIADGHHRYAAYLRLQQRHPGGPHDRGLAMLVDQGTTPLFAGPIHRTLGGVDLGDFEAAARTAGHRWEATTHAAALARLGPGTLVVTDGTAWGVCDLAATARDRAAVEELHDSVLPALPRGPQSVHYAHSVEQALRAVRRTRRLAVLMPAPDVDQVLRIVAAGRLLPEKATSFQPKPSGGVLFRSLRDE